MATIVGAYGLPHTPIFPAKVAEEGPSSPTGQLFAKVRAAFDAARPDAIVIFDTDHLNTFFLDNLPVFAVGVDETFAGPIDETRSDQPSRFRLASWLVNRCPHEDIAVTIIVFSRQIAWEDAAELFLAEPASIGE